MRTDYHIEAPVETVFEFFYDPRKQEEVVFGNYDLGEVKLTKEGVGSFYTWRGKIAGIPLQGFDVYTEVEANKHFVDMSSNAMAGTWEYRFEPEGKGTKVTMEHHSRSFWSLPPMAYLTDLFTTRMTGRLMAQVKESLETAK